MRGLGIEITLGLAACVSFILFMAAKYYAQRQRLCPEGWAECNPLNTQELAELWLDFKFMTPLLAIPIALFVGGSAVVATALSTYVAGKLRK